MLFRFSPGSAGAVMLLNSKYSLLRRGFHLPDLPVKALAIFQPFAHNAIKHRLIEVGQVVAPRLCKGYDLGYLFFVFVHHVCF